MNINKKFIVSIVATGLVIFVLSAVFSGLYLNILQEQKEFSASRTQIERLNHKQLQLSDIHKFLLAKQGADELLSTVFISADQFVFFIEVVEEIAEASGAQVDIRSFEPKNSNAPQIVFDVEGDFLSVLLFLEKFELMPYHTEIRALSFRTSGTKDVVASVTAFVHAFREN